MLQSKKRIGPWLLLGPLVLLAASCGHVQQPLPAPPVSQPVPALSQAARQPETPLWCLPTCSDGLMRERAHWRNLLTLPTSPGGPAKPATGR